MKTFPFQCKHDIWIINGDHAWFPWWRHQMETFPRYWTFVRGIHRSPVNSSHKGQWRGALMFSLVCVWINGWVNNREAGDLRRHRAHYDVIVMPLLLFSGMAVFGFYTAVRHGRGEYFVDVRLLRVDRKRHDYVYEKRIQEYLSKTKHYFRLENKANKDKVLVKLADQLLFKTRFPKCGFTYRQMVNPRQQTPQGQVAKAGTPL